MPCEQWRQNLQAYVDGELSQAENKALADHLRECVRCASQVLERVQVKRSVALAGKRYVAGAEFRARIEKDLRGRPHGATGWFWKIIAVPALLTLIFVLGLNLYVGRAKAEKQRVLGELADLHVATLASTTPVDVVSTDRHTVKPWFEGRIPFTFNLPELEGSDFSLVGGRVTYLSQVSGAHLIYRLRKHEISVFIFPESDATNTTPSAPVQVHSFTFEEWTQNGLHYFVVGDVGANDLEGLSRLLRNAK